MYNAANSSSFIEKIQDSSSPQQIVTSARKIELKDLTIRRKKLTFEESEITIQNCIFYDTFILAMNSSVTLENCVFVNGSVEGGSDDVDECVIKCVNSCIKFSNILFEEMDHALDLEHSKGTLKKVAFKNVNKSLRELECDLELEECTFQKEDKNHNVAGKIQSLLTPTLQHFSCSLYKTKNETKLIVPERKNDSNFMKLLDEILCKWGKNYDAIYDAENTLDSIENPIVFHFQIVRDYEGEEFFTLCLVESVESENEELKDMKDIKLGQRPFWFDSNYTIKTHTKQNTFSPCYGDNTFLYTKSLSPPESVCLIGGSVALKRCYFVNSERIISDNCTLSGDVTFASFNEERIAIEHNDIEKINLIVKTEKGSWSNRERENCDLVDSRLLKDCAQLHHQPLSVEEEFSVIDNDLFVTVFPLSSFKSQLKSHPVSVIAQYNRRIVSSSVEENFILKIEDPLLNLMKKRMSCSGIELDDYTDLGPLHRMNDCVLQFNYVLQKEDSMANKVMLEGDMNYVFIHKDLAQLEGTKDEEIYQLQNGRTLTKINVSSYDEELIFEDVFLLVDERVDVKASVVKETVKESVRETVRETVKENTAQLHLKSLAKNGTLTLQDVFPNLILKEDEESITIEIPSLPDETLFNSQVRIRIAAAEKIKYLEKELLRREGGIVSLPLKYSDLPNKIVLTLEENVKRSGMREGDIIEEGYTTYHDYSQVFPAPITIANTIFVGNTQIKGTEITFLNCKFYGKGVEIAGEIDAYEDEFDSVILNECFMDNGPQINTENLRAYNSVFKNQQSTVSQAHNSEFHSCIMKDNVQCVSSFELDELEAERRLVMQSCVVEIQGESENDDGMYNPVMDHINFDLKEISSAAQYGIDTVRSVFYSPDGDKNQNRNYSKDFIALRMRYTNSGAQTSVEFVASFCGTSFPCTLNLSPGIGNILLILKCSTRDQTQDDELKLQLEEFVKKNVDLSDDVTFVFEDVAYQYNDIVVRADELLKIKFSLMDSSTKLDLFGFMINKDTILFNKFLNLNFDMENDSARLDKEGSYSHIFIPNKHKYFETNMEVNQMDRVSTTEKQKEKNKINVVIKDGYDVHNVIICAEPSNLPAEKRDLVLMYDNRLATINMKKLEDIDASSVPYKEIVLEDDIVVRKYHRGGHSEVFIVAHSSFSEEEFLAMWPNKVLYLIGSPKDGITGQNLPYQHVSFKLDFSESILPTSYSLEYVEYTYKDRIFDPVLGELIVKDIRVIEDYEARKSRETQEDQIVIEGEYSLIYFNNCVFGKDTNFDVSVNIFTKKEEFECETLIFTNNSFINLENVSNSERNENVIPNDQWIIENNTSDFQTLILGMVNLSHFESGLFDFEIAKITYNEIKNIERLDLKRTIAYDLFLAYDALSPLGHQKTFRPNVIFKEKAGGNQLENVVSKDQRDSQQENVLLQEDRIIVTHYSLLEEEEREILYKQNKTFKIKIVGDLSVRDAREDGVISCHYIFDQQRDSEIKRNDIILSVESGSLKLSKAVTLLFNPSVLKNAESGGSMNNEYDGKVVVAVEGFKNVRTFEFKTVCRDSVFELE